MVRIRSRNECLKPLRVHRRRAATGCQGSASIPLTDPMTTSVSITVHPNQTLHFFPAKWCFQRKLLQRWHYSSWSHPKFNKIPFSIIIVIIDVNFNSLIWAERAFFCNSALRFCRILIAWHGMAWHEIQFYFLFNEMQIKAPLPWTAIPTATWLCSGTAATVYVLCCLQWICQMRFLSSNRSSTPPPPHNSHEALIRLSCTFIQMLLCFLKWGKWWKFYLNLI